MQLPLIYTALNTSTVSTDDTVRNPESSSISYHVHSTLPTTLHTMDVIQQQSTLGVNGILDPVSFSVISPEYQAPLVIQDHSVEDFEQPIPSISIPSLSLGNPRKGSGRGRGRGSGREGGSEGGDANTSNPLDLSDNRSLKENYLNGTSAAKMFIEEHASLIHRYVRHGTSCVLEM